MHERLNSKALYVKIDPIMANHHGHVHYGTGASDKITMEILYYLSNLYACDVFEVHIYINHI